MNSFTVAFYGRYDSQVSRTRIASAARKFITELGIAVNRCTFDGKRYGIGKWLRGALPPVWLNSDVYNLPKSTVSCEQSDIAFVITDGCFAASMAIGIHSFEVDFFTKSIEEIAISDTGTLCGIGYSMPQEFRPLNYAIGAAFFSQAFVKTRYFEKGSKALDWRIKVGEANVDSFSEVRGIYEYNLLNREQERLVEANKLLNLAIANSTIHKTSVQNKFTSYRIPLNIVDEYWAAENRLQVNGNLN